MLQLTNYSKLPSIIFNSVELTANEKIMLAYLTNRSNYFKREEDWFGVPLCDFGGDIGFTDHHKVSDVRSTLKEKGLIDYRRGGQKKATQYKVNWQNIESRLSSRYDAQNKNVLMMDRALSEEKPKPKQKTFKFPRIKEGESMTLAYSRYKEIIDNNFKNNGLWRRDYKLQKTITDYFSKAYGVKYEEMLAEVEKYKKEYEFELLQRQLEEITSEAEKVDAYVPSGEIKKRW